MHLFVLMITAKRVTCIIPSLHNTADSRKKTHTSRKRAEVLECNERAHLSCVDVSSDMNNAKGAFSKHLSQAVLVAYNPALCSRTLPSDQFQCDI